MRFENLEEQQQTNLNKQVCCTMKSSSGKYFIGLDHVRAFAAFMVFTWHFIHVNNGHHATPPIFPLSILTEGHTGVALFMALSGYLFAKLLNGKKIVYTQFLWNRFLRLAPLLFLVIIFVGIQKLVAGEDTLSYAKDVLGGLIKPSLPNGAWSITVEFHFYLILPLLLSINARWRYSLLIVIAIALMSRSIIHHEIGEVQRFAYGTIAGRIDQFILGILAYQFREKFARKHVKIMIVMLAFSCFYFYFDKMGGLYKSPSYPSPSRIWIYMPTIEGLAYASLVAWYDNSFKHSTGTISRFIALIGTYSYSIYLLHFFVVFWMANIISTQVVELSNIYLAMFFSFFCFLAMVPIGYLSYRFIEKPFFRYRTKYLIEE